MTVSTTTRKNLYTLTGAGTSFAFSFKIFAETDLVVIRKDTSNVETTLTLTTDYTVSAGPWATGGTITTVTNYADGTLLIKRQLPRTQEKSYTTASAFPAASHEEALDRDVILIQEVEEKLSRALLLPESTAYSDLSMPDPSAGSYLRWNTDGDAIENAAGDLNTSTYLPSGTNAVTRTVTAKLGEIVSVKDFGALGDGVTDDLAAINYAIAYLNTLGGGSLLFPSGDYLISDTIVIGDGTNSTVSTDGYKITLQGTNLGSGADITNTEIPGASRILWGGSTSTSEIMIDLAGPLYGINIIDLHLDCADKCGIGLNITHVTQSKFERVIVSQYTNKAYNLTTRTGFPTGCAYGCADNIFLQCYASDPSSTSTTSIYLSSGVDTGTTLSGNPDSARNIFIGGSYIYGGDTGYYGAYLYGADNNQFIGCLFYPKSGSSGGYDVYLNQWPASGDFPKENVFTNCGMTRGVSGNGGAGGGPTGGNFFFPFQTGDGATAPDLDTAQTITHDGKLYINGTRAYRGRQISTATLNNSLQQTTSASWTDVSGMSVSITTKASSQLKITFAGRASKSTTGSGAFQIVVNGSGIGPTYMDTYASGYYMPIAACYLSSVGAGTHTVKLQFSSDGTNNVNITHGCLTVQELY